MDYKRPEYLSGRTLKVKLGEVSVYITLNIDELGPVELFCSVGKAGSDTGAHSESIGRLISRALQRCESTEERKEAIESFIKDLRGIKGETGGFYEGIYLHSVSDAIGWMLQGCPREPSKKRN